MSANRRTLCCFGAGGHGRVVASQWYARTGGLVVFGDHALAVGATSGGFAVRFSAIDALHDCELIVTVGQNHARRTMQEEAEALGLILATFVADPRSYFTQGPGAGSVVLAGAVVNHAAAIGRGVIINSGAIIEHDCLIGDFSHVSPNATLAGCCEIGSECWIGAGATVLPGLVIASGTVIGAGTVVVRDIDEPGTYVGVPAARIR